MACAAMSLKPLGNLNRTKGLPSNRMTNKCRFQGHDVQHSSHNIAETLGLPHTNSGNTNIMLSHAENSPLSQPHPTETSVL